MVVDTVIRHWVIVVEGAQEGAGWEGLGTSIQALLVIFYADNRLVSSPESARLQGAFDTLTGIFNCVGLQNNKVKTVKSACWPCHTPHTWPTETYTQQVKGRGLLYREKIQQRVHCPECGVNLAAGSLKAHFQRQHGVGFREATSLPPG